MTSPELNGSPRLRQLLQFLVDAHIAAPERVLSGRDIAVGVFRRAGDFRNGEDSIVRSSVNRLRRVLSIYYATHGRNDDVVIRINPGNYTPSFLYHETKTSSKPEQAVELAQRYLHVATKSSHSAALTLIHKNLKQNPEDPLLLACFADLSLDAYKHGYDRTYANVEAAWAAIETAVSIAPDDNSILLAKAMLSLEIGEKNSLFCCTQKLLNSSDEDNILLGKWFNAIGFDDLNTMDEVPNSLNVTTSSPGWYHLPEFLRHTTSGDHEAALNAAIDFSMPGFFWGSILRASALGQLELIEAGRLQLEKAQAENPEILSSIDDYLGCYIKSANTRAVVIEGVHKLRGY